MPSLDQKPPFYSITSNYIYATLAVVDIWIWFQVVRHNRNITQPLLRPTHGSESVEIIEVSLSTGRGPAKSRQIRIVHPVSAGGPLWVCGAFPEPDRSE